MAEIEEIDYNPITDALDALDHFDPRPDSPGTIRVDLDGRGYVLVCLAESGWDVGAYERPGREDELLRNVAGEFVVEAVAAMVQNAAMQPIFYEGKLVAQVSGDRAYLDPDVAELEPTDPHRALVEAMCLYARAVAAGEVPGPYNQEDAERYAEAFLAGESDG